MSSLLSNKYQKGRTVLCYAHINQRSATLRRNMVSAREWQLETVARYLHVADQKAEQSSATKSMMALKPKSFLGRITSALLGFTLERKGARGCSILAH